MPTGPPNLFRKKRESTGRAEPYIGRYNGTVPIQLIAMDIDGTLLDSQGKLPAENVRSIGEAAARGIEIMLVTGRRFHSARFIAEQIPSDVELIASNGAVVKSKSGETHLRSLLPVGTARRVLDATEEYRRMSGVIFDRPTDNQLVFEHVDWEGPFVGPYLRRHRSQGAEVMPLVNCLDGEDPIEVMFIGECEAIRQAFGTLEGLPFCSEYTLALTEYPARGFSMLDVLRRGVTKGAALAQWAARRGITRENVLAIGDNWNDIEMLEFAGLPVVMANGVKELKLRGWAVTLSNDEDGVACAIRKYALQDRAG